MDSTRFIYNMTIILTEITLTYSVLARDYYLPHMDGLSVDIHIVWCMVAG